MYQDRYQVKIVSSVLEEQAETKASDIQCVITSPTISKWDQRSSRTANSLEAISPYPRSDHKPFFPSNSFLAPDRSHELKAPFAFSHHHSFPALPRSRTPTSYQEKWKCLSIRRNGCHEFQCAGMQLCSLRSIKI